MNEDFLSQVQRRMAELPADVQAAIASAEFEKKVQAIGQRQGLHIDQMEKLGDEIMLVMLGFMSTENFTSNIASEVGVDAEKAARITADVNAEILLPIRESLKTIASKPTEENAVAAPAPTTTPVAPTTSTPVNPISKPAAPVPHPAEMMLSQKTITVPPPTATAPVPPPQKPTTYKADPYREPPIP